MDTNNSNIATPTGSTPTSTAPQQPQSPQPAKRLGTRVKLSLADLKSYFVLTGDLEPQDVVEQSIRAGVSFKGSQLLILIFAIFIASLGLNTDSVAVIIGAMLISPLMGPIIGMGLGIGIGDFALLKRGLKNILMAMIGSILASAIYFLISPQYEGSSQLLARTSPSIYDVFVALFGGAAGIVSMACKNKGQVLPGVAIATSLMPPLCTVGYGLATLQSQYFFGALYLFFTNMVFILVATWVGVKAMQFKPFVYKDPQKSRRVKNIVYCVVALTVGISAYLTVQMIQKNIFLANASNFVNQEMVFPNTQVLSHKEYVSAGKRYIDVTLIGEALPKDSLQLAMLNKLDSCGLGGTVLNIKQGYAAGVGVDREKSVGQFYALMQQEITQRQNEIDSLKAVIALKAGFEGEAVRIAPEIKVLFPQIEDLALSNMVLANMTTDANDTVNMAFVKTTALLTEAQRQKLAQYIQVRLNRRNVIVSENPHTFPWPEPAANATRDNDKH